MSTRGARAFGDKDLLSAVTPSARIHGSKVSLQPLQTEEAMLLSATAGLARGGAESRRLGCCLLLRFSSQFVRVGYLMTSYNPSHKYLYMARCTMLHCYSGLLHKIGSVAFLLLISIQCEL